MGYSDTVGKGLEELKALLAESNRRMVEITDLYGNLEIKLRELRGTIRHMHEVHEALERENKETEPKP